MKVLLTGRGGQVGSALEPLLGPLGEVAAFDRAGLDLSDPAALERAVARVRPDVIVNAAAYTAVDRAEAEREAAFAVNSHAVSALARAAASIDALLVHFSTDNVFDGGKRAPYVETDATRPLNVYGESKLAGERAIAASGCRHAILRTSWVYAPRGRNFMLSILAAARAGRDLRVVDDQTGAPTSSAAIARAVMRVLAAPAPASGVYHVSAAGQTTWFGIAREILRHKSLEARITPVTTADYGAAAPRPRNSVLDNAKFLAAFGWRPEDWRGELAAVLAAIH